MSSVALAVGLAVTFGFAVGRTWARLIPLGLGAVFASWQLYWEIRKPSRASRAVVPRRGYVRLQPAAERSGRVRVSILALDVVDLRRGDNTIAVALEDAQGQSMDSRFTVPVGS